MMRSSGYILPEVPMTGTHTALSSDDVRQLGADINLVHLCGAVRDQGPVGSCLANAFAYAEEMWARRCGLEPQPLSSLALYAITRHDAGRQGDSGATLGETVAAAMSGGLIPEAEWEDDPVRWAEAVPDDLRARAAATRRLLHTMPLPPDSLNLRWALTCAHGVVAGLRLFEGSFASVESTGALSLPERGESRAIGHAVLLVGWSNSRRTFLSQWAWGRDFGRGGFVEIPEAYLCDPFLTPEVYALRSFRRLPAV